jgi:hypothetical protein
MKQKYDSELMAIFNFTAHDLETNRSGVISEQQLKRLRKEGTSLVMLLGGCWLAIILLASGFYNSSLRQGQFHVVVDIALGICIIAATALPISIIAFYLRERRILTQGKPAIIEGRIEFHDVYNSRNELISSIRVAEQEFYDIPIEAILKLKVYYQPRDVYRFYCALIPYQNTILSVEKAKPSPT